MITDLSDFQGYEVPLHLDASLLEEDAAAFECSTVIAANTAADRLAAAAKPPLRPISTAGALLTRGRFFCERCQLTFDTADALQVCPAFLICFDLRFFHKSFFCINC